MSFIIIFTFVAVEQYKCKYYTDIVNKQSIYYLLNYYKCLNIREKILKNT